ncbi:phosphoethanolamine transferase [Acinetobacter junii]|uniref:phosphoethanolamine transferase n=1 Tax=Acinetobacter junii TaxID=40215 RepID=UPI00125088E8|nr:phosphoethanolamine transferase [Acinetobacter junii]
MWLLLLPDLYLYRWQQDIEILALSIFIILYLCALLKSNKYLFLFTPFFFVLPVYLYYISIYHTHINEQILSIVLETNYQEAINFFGSKLFGYLVIWLFWCIGCLFYLYKCYKKPRVWSHRSRWWVLIAGTLYAIFTYIAYFNLEYQTAFSSFNQNNDFWVEEKGYFDNSKKTYPFGFILSISDLIREQKNMNQAFQHNANFKFNASSRSDSTQKQVYVLIIGETSRRANWSLNGYTRLTNPKLSQQKNLVNFSNMLAISSATRSAVPMILTRKPAEQVYTYNFPEKSIISAFKEAGFKTYWLSTQQQFGAFDTSTSVYAKEADQVIFLNKANYTDAGEYDDVLIPVLNKIIHSNEQKQFIVIHTLGSHYNYAHRYPKEYDIFKPSLNDLSKYSLQELKYKQQLVNSYDNSILFTDHVLNNMIEILKQQKQAESFLFYSSDHGEDLFDKRCGKSGHGLDTQHNLEIASFAWYSDLFASQHPSQIAYLIQNKDRKINQTAIFPTLIQAAKIHIPEYTEEKSILSPFKDYPRLVLGGKNFDSAQYDKICKEIK